nr:zinc finger Ran-binding domain-containing protein 2-like [Tanacetum cinerariifolium]
MSSGDWMCASCQHLNFKKRDACQRCHCPKFATPDEVSAYGMNKTEVLAGDCDHLEEYRQFSSELPMERRIELISNLVKYQDNYTKVYKFQSQQRKSWTKKQKRDYYMAVIRNNLGWKVKDFKGMTFKEVEAKFNSVCKQMEYFIPIGLKEEAKRIKRKVPEEKIKEIMQLVPIEEVYVEALQVKHPIIDWKVHTEHMARDDLNQLWSLVKETLSKRPATSDKEMEL